MARAPMMAAADPAAPVPPPEPAMMDAGAEQPIVLCTVLQNPDGTLMLEGGDEAEPAMGEGDEMAGPAGQTFPPDDAGIGRLLKAVLDIVRGKGQGDEGAVEQMGAGFKGANGAPAEGPV